MNRLYFHFLLFLLAGFFACNSDFEYYSTNPDNLLSFSTDTLRFDTVLATVNTPIKVFTVYNNNKKSLLISSIRLKNYEYSRFKINVDGETGTSFRDVEIRANDSLYVFVNIKPDQTGNEQPFLISDCIEFITNGRQQNVILEAFGQDVIVCKGLTINSDSILDNRKPFLIYDSLVVSAGTVLDISEGTAFYMQNKAEIIVRGTLRINGTLESPVVIRGVRNDLMVGVPYDLIPGQWGGIRFCATSFNNVINYARIRNGSFGIEMELSEPSESKLEMKNVVLTNFKGKLIRSVNCMMNVENCELSNSQGALLDLTGGHYNFIHCTMANYYASSIDAGWGNSDNQTIILSTAYYTEETLDKPARYPILQANFYNTVIWGMKYQNSSQISIEETGNESFINYYFENCLFPSKGATNDDPNNPDIVPTVVNCVINEDPVFIDTKVAKDDKDKYDFHYNFKIDSVSPARNKANSQISMQLPYDLNGVDRFLDEGPDIGAYEFNNAINYEQQ
ncbi:MAG: hypothetical protein LBH32_11155 [Dysgonamonadaceae bacterium]|jgi:hypothetical protein|nr:hypothetical protein [Dysgonamonadaceae bacterium]